jgi:predicted 3-demethylubiquinone-9 3-methyltransferase (glyoxalase superfamily)
MITVTPHLWFDKDGEKAAEFYCSLFPDSRILSQHVFENTGPDETQTVSQVEFELVGQRVMILSAGPHVKLDDAFSLFVECDTQEEVDKYWDALTADGGSPNQCGWLRDKYGVSWQVIPKLLGELIGSEDREAAGRAMHAMLQMVKIDSAELQAAYDGTG